MAYQKPYYGPGSGGDEYEPGDGSSRHKANGDIVDQQFRTRGRTARFLAGTIIVAGGLIWYEGKPVVDKVHNFFAQTFDKAGGTPAPQEPTPQEPAKKPTFSWPFSQPSH